MTYAKTVSVYDHFYYIFYNLPGIFNCNQKLRLYLVSEKKYTRLTSPPYMCVQYLGGYHECIGGYHEYIGGCLILWGIPRVHLGES